MTNKEIRGLIGMYNLKLGKDAEGNLGIQTNPLCPIRKEDLIKIKENREAFIQYFLNEEKSIENFKKAVAAGTVKLSWKNVGTEDDYWMLYVKDEYLDEYLQGINTIYLANEVYKKLTEFYRDINFDKSFLNNRDDFTLFDLIKVCSNADEREAAKVKELQKKAIETGKKQLYVADVVNKQYILVNDKGELEYEQAEEFEDLD